MSRFACEGCGKTYAWKQELAGRKVKCGCGQIMIAPQTPPEEDADLYDLKEDPAPPKPAAPPAPKTAVQSPTPQRSTAIPHAPATAVRKPTRMPATPDASGAANPALGYGTPPRRLSDADQANALGGSQFRELYLPAILTVVGLLLFVLAHLFEGGSLHSFSSALPAIGAGLLFNLVLSFAGIFVVAKLFEISFGAPGPAILKLCACCLLPVAVAGLLGDWIGSDSAFVAMGMRTVFMTPLALACFMLLFRLAMDEAFYCMVTLYLINEWAITFLMGIMFATMVE